MFARYILFCGVIINVVFSQGRIINEVAENCSSSRLWFRNSELYISHVVFTTSFSV